MAACIIPLHVLTGCHHSSGFYVTNKKLMADRLQSSNEERDLLASCGTELQAPKEVLDDLEKFVFRYIYCEAKNTTLGEVRAAKWRAQNTVRLAPDSDSLHLHLKRTNYLSFLLNHPNLPIPTLTHRTWMAWLDGLCLPPPSPHFPHRYPFP
ncbi:hypothetical protein Hamer_G025585 [Homarus americanus]|uniref:Uncharacterized protein n=1 Tax=Homarus americanus TaxID=6706 RepID=A0A8J5MNN3_HOMAM|nr:hypothetical protein Hamer_G025585 [Homarus americanus]